MAHPKEVLKYFVLCVCKNEAKRRMERQRPSAMDSGILKVNNDIID